jgi:hypothetical protein
MASMATVYFTNIVEVRFIGGETGVLGENQ